MYLGDAETRESERRSSAVTLSDMEVFIFPELIYSLVLANLMSPRIWKWRDDPWFHDITSMTPYRRITRVKQYIMDHYAFNLDLDTWGLTTKRKELARFEAWVDEDTLAQSNALFGYEGDKYYFDLDIRTHFGLDSYEGDVIPYWKTETVEAMDAFRHKPNYDSGAGECVSLATLYAAALFVVARIPLSDIFLMATPLHSQNFVDTGQGILTNNRRLVTKNMWFNGSALSAQARRALENERVTVVAHETGCIHVLYPAATIDPHAYERFTTRMRRFLQTPLNSQVLGNFVRHATDLQNCFQARWHNFGTDRYIAIEKLLAYESSFPYRFNDDTRERLMMEVAGEDFESKPLPDRIILDDLQNLVQEMRVDLRTQEGFDLLVSQFGCGCTSAQDAIERLRAFCFTDPRLPDPAQKEFKRDQPPLSLDVDMQREEIVSRLESIRDRNDLAHLSFYAYRDLRLTEPGPFLKAALERCPVSIAACTDFDDKTVVDKIRAMPAESIYDGPGRLAQPDEAWNYERGDGVEKALLLANVLRSRHAAWGFVFEVQPDKVTLEVSQAPQDQPVLYQFASVKDLPAQRWTDYSNSSVSSEV